MSDEGNIEMQEYRMTNVVPGVKSNMHFAIPLGGPKLVHVWIPWPLTDEQADLVLFQLDHALAVIRRLNEPRWKKEAEMRQLESASTEPATSG